jgi:uncharacterized protein YndB with AHSA1/START domain
MTTTVPPVLAAVHVRQSPEDAFRIFTHRIGEWWPLPTHGCFADRTAGVEFADGLLVERSLDGETAVWGEVLAWDPPRRFSCTWHPGYTDGRRTVVEVDFRPDSDGTRVELAHHGWEVFAADAEARRDGYSKAGGWPLVLSRFQAAAGG